MRIGLLLSTVLISLLDACGGGGGGSSPASAPTAPGAAAQVIANLSTGSATNITNTLASLNGYFVNAAGRTTEAWFEWGTTAAYGHFTASTYYGYAGGISQSKNISGLVVSTTYHYIFCAQNSDGKVCGGDKTFTPAPMQAIGRLQTGQVNPDYLKYFVVEGGSAYWLLGGSGGSLMAKAVGAGAGAAAVVATGLAEPFGLAVDGTNAYWTEQSGGTGSTGALKWKALSGAGTPAILADNLNNPQFAVLAGGYVYFSELGTWDNTAGLRKSDGSIKRVPVGGGVVSTLASNLNGPQSIHVDATHLYWTELANYLSGAGSVNSVPLAGGTVVPLVLGLTGSQNIALDAANVYFWSSYGTLSSVPLSGATGVHPMVQLASGINGTPALATDVSSIYWAEAANGGALKRLTKATGNVTVLTSTFDRPDWIALDASSVYWLQDDSWNGSAWRGDGDILQTAK